MKRKAAIPQIPRADTTLRGLRGCVGAGVAAGESAALIRIDCPGVAFPEVMCGVYPSISILTVYV